MTRRPARNLLTPPGERFMPGYMRFVGNFLRFWCVLAVIWFAIIAALNTAEHRKTGDAQWVEGLWWMGLIVVVAIVASWLMGSFLVRLANRLSRR